MEWVETTGKTVDEAKDLALDQLGVDEQDAEFEVLEEPRSGLFGRVRGEARVRARVRPTQPRPKVERRERKGRTSRPKGGGERSGTDGGSRGGRSKGGRNGERRTAEADRPSPTRDSPEASKAAAGSEPDPSDSTPATPAPAPAAKRASRPPREGRSRTNRPKDQESTEMSETEQLAQGDVAQELLIDLLDAFDLDGDVAMGRGEDGAVELSVTGEDLGLLIGPKGQTLQAIQELARTVAQRSFPGDHGARIRIDVAGYRQRRREALERFVNQVAEDVKSSGVQKALEPMSPPDRKVVHDTVNTIDGVHTISEGEDARRRVVIIPD